MFLSLYNLELSLVEVTMNRYRPDILACASIYVAKKIIQEKHPWSTLMTK